MKIELDRLPDSNLSPNKRLHHMELYKAKAAAKMDAVMLVLSQGKPSRPYEKAHITITWVAKDKRRRDTDNFAARTKPYIDALVLAGVLEDDSRFHVLFQFSWHEAGQSETVITVT